MYNSFGNHYRITTFGESHGAAIGVIIDGCPPGYPIDLDALAKQLSRRRPGQSHITTSRDEADQPEILSGIENGITLGTPITIIVRNTNTKPKDYGDMKEVFRPSHADYTTWKKYGIRPGSGGGRASARETIGRVAGAAIAEQILVKLCPGFKATAWVDSVGNIKSDVGSPESLNKDTVDANIVRCPDAKAAKEMIKFIEAIKKDGDTVGGTVTLCLSNVPAGVGDPVFGKLDAALGGAMLSLPAAKGVEIGLGFACTLMRGSEHNDEFAVVDGDVKTLSNNSGGIQGGIANGSPIITRVAFKPVSTIFKKQKTVDTEGNEHLWQPKGGRHDPCVVPRAVPMVEAMGTLVVMEHVLAQKGLVACRFEKS